MTTNIAVLFSGGGRTILNLLECIEQKTLDAHITLAIASRPGIAGIQRLINRGLDIAVARSSDESPEEGDQRVQAWLNDARPDLICLCGYLRLLSIEPWMEGRIINIHPSLLPNYGGKGMFGMRVHEAVVKQGDTETGCTVHYVDEEYDHGPTILQRTCPVLPSDTPEIIADRVFSLECEMYPDAIKIAAEQLRV
ncbi:MAG: phosphoribosylglycinamide formyltransferase [Phycisphaerales bacterium]|nr:phosphoribosylglycinamide formyltransferase [Planctomycetota bacterium]MBL6997528.1 phosphoribosylglycinamide formyltransferase [Phycisphaerales bacterium]